MGQHLGVAVIGNGDRSREDRRGGVGTRYIAWDNFIKAGVFQEQKKGNDLKGQFI